MAEQIEVNESDTLLDFGKAVAPRQQRPATIAPTSSAKPQLTEGGKISADLTSF